MCDCFLVKEHEDTVADLVETIPCRPVKLTPVIFPYLCSTSGRLYVCTSYHRVFAGTSKLSLKTQVKVVNGASLVLVIFSFQNVTPVYKDGLQVVSSKLFYPQPHSTSNPTAWNHSMMTSLSVGIVGLYFWWRKYYFSEFVDTTPLCSLYTCIENVRKAPDTVEVTHLCLLKKHSYRHHFLFILVCGFVT